MYKKKMKRKKNLILFQFFFTRYITFFAVLIKIVMFQEEGFFKKLFNGFDINILKIGFKMRSSILINKTESILISLNNFK